MNTTCRIGRVWSRGGPGKKEEIKSPVGQPLKLTLTKACSFTPLILTVVPRSLRERSSAAARAENEIFMDADLSVASICREGCNVAVWGSG